MSSRFKHSLLDFKTFEKSSIDQLFAMADEIARDKKAAIPFTGETVALLFFEASTRTRMSFETACARLGTYPLRFDGKSGTSLEKGESLVDTVLNVDAMNPSVLVIRCGDNLDLHELAGKVNSPIINAGWGKQGHPTQALLDAYTIRQNLGTCEKQKVLIVGDIVHSRVAASHLELAKLLNYEVAFCGPAGFIPTQFQGRVFGTLSEGLKWCTVAMALRVQSERHQAESALDNYSQQFGFTTKSLTDLSSKALILHPGPINHGTEMDEEVLSDGRCRVLQQVSNGVFIRQALIHRALREEQS